MSYQQYGQPYGQPPPHQGYPQQYPPPHHQQGYPQQQPQGYHQPLPQQGHYGAPPPPPQQGGYYQAPPPGQHYGQQPPPGQYGAPPPGQYGAPPPQPYGHQGAPPPVPYNTAPPPGAPYGAPPPQQYAAPTQPTPPSPGYGAPQHIQWNAGPDAQGLRSAMKGFGTDEKALIRILSNKDPLQIEAIRSEFERSFKRKLVHDIEKETSSWFETGLVQLARGPLATDVHLLHWSMSGPGTKEVVLNDVLLSRSNADIHAIKSAYRREFGRNLEDAVRGDLSMKTERHFIMVLSGKRAEDSAPVIPHQIDDDVMQIYKATEGKVGTDEILVCSILTYRNDNQIRAISQAYRQKFNKDLDKVIRSEFSGHMKEALLHQLLHATDKYMHVATLLEDAMAGMGTKDHLLVARVIRFHWDRNTLSNVKGAYQQRYNRSLASRIKGETSGDYERLMLACVGEWS